MSKNTIKTLLVVTCIVCTGLSACSGNSVAATPTVTIQVETATFTLEPTSTPTALPPTATPIPYTGISSPLQNISLDELNSVDTNPFDPPPLGFDEPHQGIDYSYYRFENDLMTDSDGIEGLEVLSVLDGTVISVINDRMPYGNAIIIETPLNMLLPQWLAAMQIPEIAATLVPDPRHNCPDLVNDPSWDDSNRSLYFVYAHLLNPPQFSIGDAVKSGEVIGQVGNTGNSSNAHLHLELRLGPGGASFDSMAKYDTRASVEEMAAYCTWRISNRFELIDPNTVLQFRP
ncbi:MAG: M23 family metallopeptidase [Chloroflexi bacterium]|nr:M23 family metallopeptidase [Chloroflexota bacterium]